MTADTGLRRFSGTSAVMPRSRRALADDSAIVD